MQRPLGVTIIAAIQFAGTAFLIAASFVLGTGIIDSILVASRSPAWPRFVSVAGGGRLAATAVLLLAVFLGALGYGMWHLRNWARITTITVEALSAIFTAFAIFWTLAHGTVFLLLCASIRLATNVIILWYLNQPQVVRAFVPGPGAG